MHTQTEQLASHCYDDYITLFESVKESPAISVIVPVFNKSNNNLLSDCLDSLCAQVNADYEIVVVDDKSTDESLSIAIDYARRYENITLITIQENVRQGGARNRGLALAKGEYICFVDADDFVQNNYLHLLYSAIQSTNAQVAVAPYQLTDLHGTPYGQVLQNTPTMIAGELSDQKRAQLILHHDHIVTHMFRADLVRRKDSVFPEGVSYEDTPTLIHWIFNMNSIVVLSKDDTEPLYFYRQNPTSTVHTTGINEKALRDREASSQSIIKQAKSAGVYERFAEELDFYTYTVAFVNTFLLLAKTGTKEARKKALNLTEYHHDQIINIVNNKHYKNQHLMQRLIQGFIRNATGLAFTCASILAKLKR